MKILGIETSCDDTAAALLEVKAGCFKLLSHLTASQTKLHAKYQGVVPEVAARSHLETIIPVLTEVLSPLLPEERVRVRSGGTKFSTPNPHPCLAGRRATLSLEGRGNIKLDVIAVTTGPGLITSLLVGVETAKALSFAWNIPLVGVNHIEGHIYSPLLPVHPTLTPPEAGRPTSPLKGEGTLRFPAIALIVSGGHTELILMTDHGRYKLLGRTRDDAAGECFDKAAKMLGLPYPGGPEISKRAAKGNPAAFGLPRPMIKEGLEFSFSGLKNAIRLLIESIKSTRHPERSEGSRQSRSEHVPRDSSASLQNDVIINLCASIEQAIIDVLVHKSLSAVNKYKPKTFILAGGVAANRKLRQTLQSELPKSARFLLPAPEFCMDNAAMIAVAAFHHIKKKQFIKYNKLKANANWELV